MPFLTHDRIELAIEQLECALHIFLKCQSYVSTLTLAGAAEEVLGKALSHQGKETTLQVAHRIPDLIHRTFHGKPLSWSDFAEQENFVRNAVKHMRKSSDAAIEVDLELAAIWMLVRACDNYQRLGLAPSDQMNAFNDWFLENVGGI